MSRNCSVMNLRQDLKTIDREFRKSHSWLKYQSAIGLTISLVSAGVMIAVATLYYFGIVPALLAIVLIAFFQSFLHEIEHDTFHNLYFKNQRGKQAALLTFCWVFKPNTMNPFMRKTIHLHHHVHSGTPEDIEERLISNGLPYRVRRFLILADILFCFTQFRTLIREAKDFKPLTIMTCIYPMHAIFTAIWVLWASFYVVAGLNATFGLSLATFSFVAGHIAIFNFLMVVYILPSLLRTFSLHFMTTSLHYYGGVDSVLKQTQVFDKWYFLPFQLFCCAFGQSHAIHHIYVPQPFYIRHLTRKASLVKMKEAGVCFNDMGTFVRNNAYPEIEGTAAESDVHDGHAAPSHS
ncbi:fatty acid desaturase [Flexibacterium corallicola]|uniref:fatty acid desaturase n=1 Tax=Flexibacterium corallicola TaxID=3037259 RepID=UPI00286F5422|nr:fatty acid desaturase [Pseudovibrio sp. M1P-2-3]